MNAAELETALAAAESSGISNHILRILCILQNAAPQAITPTHLAHHLNISRAAIGGLIATMNERGFINVRPVVEDKRVTPYAITDYGTAILSRILNHTNKQS